MKKLNDQLLIDSYLKAIELDLNKNFILVQLKSYPLSFKKIGVTFLNKTCSNCKTNSLRFNFLVSKILTQIHF
ncbi:sporulation histidine kinase inhibitor Sda [Peribacillus frigoritolerans]|uniref:sporulation histidine kinase inhibitor Sda n=1 Tax=Peribacillus frigoritolerans TaxID=450367 RepID=UPI0035116388